LLTDAREVNVVQLQLLDLTTPKECVSVPVAARTELIALMARILVVVYQPEGGRRDDGVFLQFQNQGGARLIRCAAYRFRIGDNASGGRVIPQVGFGS
jgi:hypothetical protein